VLMHEWAVLMHEFSRTDGGKTKEVCAIDVSRLPKRSRVKNSRGSGCVPGDWNFVCAQSPKVRDTDDVKQGGSDRETMKAVFTNDGPIDCKRPGVNSSCRFGAAPGKWSSRAQSKSPQAVERERVRISGFLKIVPLEIRRFRDRIRGRPPSPHNLGHNFIIPKPPKAI
jgi:hypothetical protein